MNAGSGVSHWNEDDGRIFRVRLERPPGHILDRALVGDLRDALAQVPATSFATVLDSSGAHFSYGASIPEHAPGRVGPALVEFHGLVKVMLSHPVPLACAVRGRCLGGGLEVALACDRIVAAPDASLGCPEIRIGALAPAASVLLPERMGAGASRELLLTGRAVDAREALAIGLVDAIGEDPSEAAVAWARASLLGLSRSSLRLAVRAARLTARARVLPALDEVERLYLDELMATPDAAEGVAAFLDKRPPRWSS